MQTLRSNAREAKTSTIVLCGLVPGSGTHADLGRGGLKIRFLTSESKDSSATGPNEILSFDTRMASLEWCKRQMDSRAITDSSELTMDQSKPAFGGSQSLTVKSLISTMKKRSPLLRMPYLLLKGCLKGTNRLIHWRPLFNGRTGKGILFKPSNNWKLQAAKFVATSPVRS